MISLNTGLIPPNHKYSSCFSLFAYKPSWSDYGFSLFFEQVSGNMIYQLVSDWVQDD